MALDRHSTCNVSACRHLSTRPVDTVRINCCSHCTLLADATRVHLQNLNIVSRDNGIVIHYSALIRLNNVAVTATTNTDGIGLAHGTCNGCNVVLGSRNAAVVVQNSYWLWFFDSSFTFGPDEHTDGSLIPHIDHGQRPSVILRGATVRGQVDTTYLVRFERVVFAFGGVQYQQLGTANQDAGWFDFVDCTMEGSASPLLDVQSSPGDYQFAGVHTVTIETTSDADNLLPNYCECTLPCVSLAVRTVGEIFSLTQRFRLQTHRIKSTYQIAQQSISCLLSH